ncbi:MAG: DUF5602 domain-containing protein [Caulobacteraceae bacterium]
MLRKLIIALGITGAIGLTAGPAAAAGVETSPPPAPYQEVCKLVKLPCFLPGLGTLYVNPKTIPAGPWLAYDHRGRLISTIFMIPLSDLNAEKRFVLSAPGGRVDHVTLQFNAGHPGVPVPHYHIILWHVPVAQERLVAK